MQAFNSELFLTTSEAAELLEVHPSTVKRWTDSGDLVSEKTDGGHRRIYLRDVLDFSRERNQLTYLVPFTPFESHVWLAMKAAAQGDFDRIVNLAMGWLIRGYPRRITALVLELGSREQFDLAQVCDGAIRPFMAEVGSAWQEGRLRIGDEHIASQAVLEALVRLSSDTVEGTPGDSSRGSPASPPRVAVVGSMEDNRHHLGGMCARILLERSGWMVHYLGADTPPEEFAAIQRAREAELVCVSFSPRSSVGDMVRCLDVLGEFHRSHAPFDLVFGGVGVGELGTPGSLPFRSFRVMPSAQELAAFLRDHPVPVPLQGSPA